MALLLEILEHDYLHPKIREEGGAYGARAQIRNNDTITLYSYMDPNAAETFFAFDQSIAELLSSSISPEQIN
jgi:Zn-dependent M16 (insulinase) family peptidase